MPRNLATANQAAVLSRGVELVLLVRLDFHAETVYLASTPFNLAWNGQTWLGVGALGKVSGVTEDTEVNAQATVLTISGVPTEFVSDALAVVTYGGLAQLYFGFLSQGALVTDPLPANLGLIDGPSFDIGDKTCSISISIESEMSDLQRARGGRLTTCDQRSRYPWDACCDIVSQIQDKLLLWQ
jgi:hypothetical protein